MGTNLKGAVPTPHPNWSHDEVWTWIQDKIHTGDYLEIINWIASIQNTKTQESHTAVLASTAIDLCKICDMHQTETEASWETFQRSVSQEKALGKNLSALLKTLLSEAKEKPATSMLQGLEQDKQLAAPNSPSDEDQAGFWKRIQNLINRPQNSARASPEIQESNANIPNYNKNISQNKAENLPLIEPAISPLFSQEKKSKLSQEALYLSEETEGIPSLSIYLLGPFRVYQDDQPVLDWSNSKSASLFKYLLSRRHEKIAKEVLMDTFWPSATPDAARNNLNVTIYNLRKTLRNGYHNFSHILFKDGAYLLNSDMPIWIDTEAFEHSIQTAQEYERNGRLPQAINLYHAAEALYQGAYLSEDRYEDWPIPTRQKYRELYLEALTKLSNHYYDNGELSSSIRLSKQILTIDTCREETHRQLMRSYAQLGQSHLALRQFHQLSECLQEELDVQPSQETIQLLTKIRSHNQV